MIDQIYQRGFLRDGALLSRADQVQASASNS